MDEEYQLPDRRNVDNPGKADTVQILNPHHPPLHPSAPLTRIASLKCLFVQPLLHGYSCLPLPKVARLAGFDQLPDDVEYILDGKKVPREAYKRRWKALKRAKGLDDAAQDFWTSSESEEYTIDNWERDVGVLRADREAISRGKKVM